MSTRCVTITELMHLQVRGVSFSPSGLRFSLTPCTEGTSSERLYASLLGSHPNDIGIVPSGTLSIRVVGLVAYFRVGWLAFNLFEV
jgi:hypothetical protein